ncbi:MAG: type II toxin-antitoxin system prevent-host-death family antitoxin, partial [Thermoanaerobaculia bacterium]
DPVLVERRGEPAAVLISLADYRERFVDVTADEERREVVRRIREMAFSRPAEKTTLDLLRELRS